jgi:hypothetical protein
MGNLFSKPKATKIPAPKPVAPPPIETAAQAGEEVKKQKPTGREVTFITGDLVPEQKKKDKLG